VAVLEVGKVRPKKRILVIDSSETRLSTRRFVLETRGLAVAGASTPDEARDLANSFQPEVIVAAWPFTSGDLGRLLGQLHDELPFAPTLLIAESLVESPSSVTADATVLKGGCSMAEIVERIKILAARKRGPRPETPKPVQSIERMMQLAERRLA
jgi:DNA-binding response OmpR family regulator